MENNNNRRMKIKGKEEKDKDIFLTVTRKELTEKLIFENRPKGGERRRQ